MQNAQNIPVPTGLKLFAAFMVDRDVAYRRLPVLSYQLRPATGLFPLLAPQGRQMVNELGSDFLTTVVTYEDEPTEDELDAAVTVRGERLLTELDLEEMDA